MASVVVTEDPARVLGQLLHPRAVGCCWAPSRCSFTRNANRSLPTLPVDRLDAGHRVRPDAGGNRHRPRREPDLLRIFLPLSMGPGDRQKLFGVRPGSLSELARQAGQAACVLHVVQELGRAVGVRGHDDLTGGPGAVMEMRRALGPAGMAGSDFEPAPIERCELVHLVQVVDLDAEFLGQIQVIRRQLVLRVVPATVVAAGFHDADPVALLRGAERGDAPAEPRADDQHVVVEARHELSSFPTCVSW